MCDSAALQLIDLRVALEHCDITTQPNVFAHADSAGDFTLEYQVRKSFPLLESVVACGQAPNDCAILVAQVTNDGSFRGAAAAISFTPLRKTLADCVREFHADRDRLLPGFRRSLLCSLGVVRQHDRGSPVPPS